MIKIIAILFLAMVTMVSFSQSLTLLPGGTTLTTTEQNNPGNKYVQTHTESGIHHYNANPSRAIRIISGTPGKLFDWSAVDGSVRIVVSDTITPKGVVVGATSFAFGRNVSTPHTNSIGMGEGIATSTNNSVVFGKFNGTNNPVMSAEGYMPVFEFGWGNSNTDRKNLFTVLQNGNFGINSYQPRSVLEVIHKNIPSNGDQNLVTFGAYDGYDTMINGSYENQGKTIISSRFQNSPIFIGPNYASQVSIGYDTEYFDGDYGTKFVVTGNSSFHGAINSYKVVTTTVNSDTLRALNAYIDDAYIDTLWKPVPPSGAPIKDSIPNMQFKKDLAGKEYYNQSQTIEYLIQKITELEKRIKTLETKK